MKKSKTEEQFFKVLMILSLAAIVGVLFMMLWTLISKGAAYLNWGMISKVPQGGFYIGKEGGILNAIAGSVYITIGSAILGLLTGIPIVLYLNVYASKNSGFAQAARLALDVLSGIPSIVYGSFGFTIMLFLGLKASLLAGIITVTLLIIPIMVRSMDEVMRTVPGELADAVYALGGTRWEAAQVLLRQSVPGIMTAVLLSFGRAIGDAACVLFTAGYTDSIPASLSQPTATLPLSIFFQLSSPVEEVQGRAYASALILTIIVLILSLTAKYFNKKLSKYKL